MSFPSTERRPLHRRPLVRIAAAAGAVLVVVGLVLFEPWQLVVDQRVDEAAPVAAAPAAPVDPAAPAAPVEPAAPAEPVVLARGELISHEHESSGAVVVLELPDGSRVLRLEDLNTSNGPALQVWITDAPVIEGRDGWHVFDDGRYVDLGELKGNIGSSNYPLPPEVDLTQLSSVTVWCERFAVSFAAAALEPVAA
jgi:Electron transfer DM13